MSAILELKEPPENVPHDWKNKWKSGDYKDVKNSVSYFIVCACTPCGAPPDEWRPDNENKL